MNCKRLLTTIALTGYMILPMESAARDFVHVFTSKGVYETCEDMWFKAVTFNDSTLEVSQKPHTAYVEIVNPQDSAVWEEKYPMANGECQGHIYVGDNWTTGIYRMYVSTSGSVHATDTTLTPTRILIVNELPEAKEYVYGKKRDVIIIDSLSVDSMLNMLTVTVELDSMEYRKRGKIAGKLTVTDRDGKPVKARVALSVYDHLYDYPPGDLDMVSHCYGVLSHAAEHSSEGVALVPDNPVSGSLTFKKEKSKKSTEGQLINVFDFNNTKGGFNLISTVSGGYFEVPYDMAETLNRDILLKPVSSTDQKPELAFSDPFMALAQLRQSAKDKYLPNITSKVDQNSDNDTLDYTGRGVVNLDEVVVKGREARYPKRNKLMGYLDSISSMGDGAWVCGCQAGNGTTFLNDYIPGYTHHPNRSMMPKKIMRPEKGKNYELIKYSPETIQGVKGSGYVMDIRYITYEGPRFTEEELLKMNGLYKTKGYYPKRSFSSPDDEEMSYGLEDNRNTLLWIPSATTDENGELPLEFFASDIPSNFIIRCIAYTEDGRAVGEGRLTFRVR